jgi:hypothetical protein
MERITLNVINAKDEILKALLESKESNSIIGIKAAPLGPGTYMTNVVNLIIDGNYNTTIVLRGYDMTGYFFDTSTVHLEEIEGVIPFSASFENPFLRDVKREIRSKKTA